MTTPRLPFKKTVSELAGIVGGQAEGDPAYLLTGVAGLHEAGAQDVSFFGNPRYSEAAVNSGAGCLLLPENGRALKVRSPNRIFVDDPQRAFGRILDLIDEARPKPAAGVSPRAWVHPRARVAADASVGDFAVVEEGALVEEGASVGAQCYVGRNARVGKDSRLYPGVVLREDCLVGARAVVHSGAVIGADGFGFSTDKKTGRHRKIPQLGNVVVEDDVEIGANVTIDRATIGSTVIGAGTKIDNLVQIGHNVKTGRDCLLVAQSGVSGSSHLGSRVILAGQAGIAGHLKLGDGVIVMAQSGVMSDVEKGNAVFGSPARPRMEAMKLQALYGRLPELFDALKALKEKLGFPPSMK